MTDKDVILVAGSSKGLGRLTSVALARRSYRVVP
jgi:hypothetical protein